MREPIHEARLPREQLETLELVRRASVRAAVNEILRERGIPLTVYRLEMAAEPEPTTKLREEEWPPPGGCYCCSDGACYCC
jgi:hypothetical protein